ncbi:Chitin synthase 4, partial [Coemansia nantahalensis]
MTKVNKRVLAVLGALGVYQEGIMAEKVGDDEVHAHVFEYTVQSGLDTNMQFHGHEQRMPPVQVLFCLKVKNAKKINSHRWFFNAFAPVLQPNICVLIDVGTKPTGTSIYHLWKSFDHDERVAGACGEIAADLGKGCRNVFMNPLVAAQNFEYKISNILDKPLESVFGYITVLPGAFSAYRYKALQNTSPTEGPLYEYFKGELMHTDGSDSSIFQANMYLAEDRILCFELVSKRRENYILRYVRAAKAVTDVPDSLDELISQRRRWLNGSFFATFYALVHWYRMVRTSHSLYRRVMLTIELIYQTISMIFSWFSISNFYLAYFFLEQNLKAIYDSQKTPNPDSLNADPFHGAGYIVME